MARRVARKLGQQKSQIVDDTLLWDSGRRWGGRRARIVGLLPGSGFAHDPGGPDAGGIDVNTEVLFAKPWGTQAEWWLPRPHLGATISLDGRTSTVYGGATWQVDLTSSLFAEASFGASLNNAATVDEEEADALGCTALFRSSASLGYRMTAHWSVMASVEHSSNAGLCDRNRGLTNTGLRLGYRF